MDEEKKYTLEEARKILALRECSRAGHDWMHLHRGDGEMIRVVCRCCTLSYRVVQE